MNRITTMIVATALATGAQLAHADDNLESPPHVQVRFDDIDLNGVKGAAALYRRLYSASQSVCGPLANDLAHYERYKACITETVSKAVTDVGNPALTAYYRAQVDGHSPAPAQIAQRR